MATSIIPAHHVERHLRGHDQSGRPARQRDRGRQGHDRRQLPDLPDAADHAAQEPEPARSARHQPVHRAARAVRAGRAAAQVQRPARHAGLAAADRADDRRARTSSARRSASPARPPRSPTARATWNLTGAQARHRHDHHHERDRPDRLQRQLFDERRHAAVRLGRQGRQRPAMARRQLHDLGHRAGRQRPAGRRSRPRSKPSSTPPISPRPRRCFRSPDRTTRSTRSSAWCAIPTDRAVTLRSFLAAGAIAPAAFSSQICWEYAAIASCRPSRRQFKTGGNFYPIVWRA